MAKKLDFWDLGEKERKVKEEPKKPGKARSKGKEEDVLVECLQKHVCEPHIKNVLTFKSEVYEARRRRHTCVFSSSSSSSSSSISTSSSSSSYSSSSLLSSTPSLSYSPVGLDVGIEVAPKFADSFAALVNVMGDELRNLGIQSGVGEEDILTVLTLLRYDKNDLLSVLREEMKNQFGSFSDFAAVTRTE